MEKQGTESCTEQCHLYGQYLLGTLKIAVYQNRYKNCRSEHSEHMLQTKQQHFRRTQNPGISYNVFLLVHYEKLLIIIVYSNIRQSAGALAYV